MPTKIFAIIAFILNTPWTFLGAILALFSWPRGLSRRNNLMIKIQKARWGGLFPWMNGKIKGITLGNVILISPLADNVTITHELIHANQFSEAPFIFLFFYLLEFFKNGYENNKYEIAARELSQQKIGEIQAVFK